MAHELLELDALLTMSRLSDTAIGGWLQTDQEITPVVAVADWILPKDVFVMVWFWYMLDSKLYSKKWDNEKWDPIIFGLNNHKFQDPSRPKLYGRVLTSSNNWSNNWLETVYLDLCKVYKKHAWTVVQKNEIFQQVVGNLARN